MAMDGPPTINEQVKARCLFWSEIDQRSTSLDPIETNVMGRPETQYLGRWSDEERRRIDRKDNADQREIPIASPLESSYRHQAWQIWRSKVIESLVRIAAPTSRLERFRQCGAAAVIEHSKTANKLRVRAFFCHDRHCEACAAARQKKIVLELTSLMAGKRCSFITLTLKHNAEPLREQLSRLIRCFRALRIKALWRHQVKGCAYFIELKRSGDGLAWHPHLHIIAECGYIAATDLSSAWRQITGDSFVVHIRRVEDATRDARYVAKYASKALDRSACAEERWLDEAVISLRGRRLMSTCGLWRRHAPEHEDEKSADWERVAGLEQALNAANNGEVWAIGLLAWLRHKAPAEVRRSDEFVFHVAEKGASVAPAG